MRFKSRLLVGLACLVTVCSTSLADDLVVEDSFVYKTLTGRDQKRELRIDWTRPSDWQETDSRPAAIFFHGGGWTSGKPGQFAMHSKTLAERGMVCFRAEYRLTDKKSRGPMDVCIADACDAIRAIRERASEFGIDGNRIAAGGGSAGGHLAAYLGMMDDEPVAGISRKANAMLLFNPIYDLGPDRWGHSRVGDDYAAYSPAHHITADDPPAIVFFGTSDDLVPVAVAESFRDQSHKAGLISELHLYQDQPHGFFNVGVDNGKHYRDSLDKTVQFLTSLEWIENE